MVGVEWAGLHGKETRVGGKLSEESRVDDPLYAQRNPFQTFLLGFGLAAAIPLLQGDTGSATLERELDDTAVVLWGAALLIGSFLGLFGSFWPRGDARQSWTGLNIERTGLILVGGAGAVYGFVLVWTARETADVWYIASVQSAFVAACFWRVGQIFRRMRWWKRTQLWMESPEILEAEQ